MAAPPTQPEIDEVAPDFLSHLARAFACTEAQAMDALGAYIMSTEAGLALRRGLASSECQPSVAAA